MTGPSSARLLVGEESFGPAAQAMVSDQLRQRQISDPRVLEAMRQIPRHVFLDPALADQAYEDRPLATLHGQTISQPYMVALMTQVLELARGHRVLEIGTGSGYQTMILEWLVGESVVSVERDPELSAMARKTLTALGAAAARLEVGDGSLGFAPSAPYDRILVTASAPEAPQALLDQLAPGGRLIIPVGSREHQNLAIIEKGSTGRLNLTWSTGCRFVPLVGAQAWAEV